MHSEPSADSADLVKLICNKHEYHESEFNGGEGAVFTIAGRAVHLGIHRYHRSRHAENISVL
jgi:hypothetical protein